MANIASAFWNRGQWKQVKTMEVEVVGTCKSEKEYLAVRTRPRLRSWEELDDTLTHLNSGGS